MTQPEIGILINSGSVRSAMADSGQGVLKSIPSLSHEARPSGNADDAAHELLPPRRCRKPGNQLLQVGARDPAEGKIGRSHS